MTFGEVNKFHNILQARVIEFNSSTRQRDAIVIEKSADEFESRIQAAEREAAVRKLETESNKLREARAALLRIREGTFGICEECEEQISPRRLAALPWAALCIRCQETADGNGGEKHVQHAFAMAA